MATVDTREHRVEPRQGTVRSADGTTIAYEERGAGPVVILVDPALVDRRGSAKLAALLAETHRVISYDRRGRGRSGDTPPYAVQREVEDLAALIGATGGAAHLFGQSSGAVLALDAATALGTAVRSAVLYEPPFVVDGSRPPIDQAIGRRAAELVRAGDPTAAVRLFYTRAMGIPGFGVTIMRIVMPTWKTIVAAAHTLPFDFALMDGTQDGAPLPAARWAGLRAPTLALVGARSEPWFHSGARALAELLPVVQYRSLEGANHGSPTMSPRRIVSAVTSHFER